MGRHWMLVVAVLLVLVGITPSSTPDVAGESLGWVLAYGFAALTAVAFYFRPDKRHLRYVAATISAVEVVRALAILLEGVLYASVWLHLLLAIVVMAFYKARTNAGGFDPVTLPDRVREG